MWFRSVYRTVLIYFVPDYNKIMYYVYILLSKKDNDFYIGFTEDLRQRIKRHKNAQVFATKSRLPIILIFYEAYSDKYDALRREKYLKSSKGKTTIKTMLKECLFKNKLER